MAEAATAAPATNSRRQVNRSPEQQQRRAARCQARKGQGQAIRAGRAVRAGDPRWADGKEPDTHHQSSTICRRPAGLSDPGDCRSGGAVPVRPRSIALRASVGKCRPFRPRLPPGAWSGCQRLRVDGVAPTGPNCPAGSPGKGASHRMASQQFNLVTNGASRRPRTRLDQLVRPEDWPQWWRAVRRVERCARGMPKGRGRAAADLADSAALRIELRYAMTRSSPCGHRGSRQRGARRHRPLDAAAGRPETLVRYDWQVSWASRGCGPWRLWWSGYSPGTTASSWAGGTRACRRRSDAAP